jgi:hypothetical protein
MLQDLGSDSGAATRKLMQNLITCTAQTKLTQLVSTSKAALLCFTRFTRPRLGTPLGATQGTL